jgi:serine/threonine protein phosphatase PrpC
MSALDTFGISISGIDGDENEDYFVMDPGVGVFLVADGLGGRPGGALASRTAGQSLLTRVRDLRADSRLDPAVLRAAIEEVHRDVLRLAEADALLSGLGTTLSAVVLDGSRGVILHVGDSRVYIFQNGQLKQLTQDHSLAAELVAQGRLRSQAVEHYPLRHVLTRNIGGAGPLVPEVSDVEPGPHDWILLATDGLAKSMSVERLEQELAAGVTGSATDLGRRLTDIVAKAEPNDSVTFVLLRAAH